MSSITIEFLGKRFGDTAVLHGASLQIPQGAIVGLLAPSGCGKTTLLRMIAGFDKPDEGTISFDSTVIASAQKWVPPEKRGIGYVPQEGTLFPHLNVAGNIRYGLPRSLGRQEADRRIQHVLDLVGLSSLGNRYPQELSGGQQQRVALARALAPGPRLMLLDEPFNALDLDLRRGMCEEVAQVLRKTNTTTILVTHDPGEAFAVSDKLAVMQAGVIMQCASPQEVYWQPASAAVASLTGPVVQLDGVCADGVAATALGDIPLHTACRQVQGAASIVLRPEQIRLGAEEKGWEAGCALQSAAPSISGAQARIKRRSFRGDHTMMEIQVANVCLRLRIPSLFVPKDTTETTICVHGACMAYPAG